MVRACPVANGSVDDMPDEAHGRSPHGYFRRGVGLDERLSSSAAGLAHGMIAG